MFNDCRINDWDGYGANAITQSVIDKTINFVKSLPSDVPQPECTPESDGCIAVEWFGEGSATLSISIGESNYLSYSAIFYDGTSDHGVWGYQSMINDRR